MLTSQADEQPGQGCSGEVGQYIQSFKGTVGKACLYEFHDDAIAGGYDKITEAFPGLIRRSAARPKPDKDTKQEYMCQFVHVRQAEHASMGDPFGWDHQEDKNEAGP